MMACCAVSLGCWRVGVGAVDVAGWCNDARRPSPAKCLASRQAARQRLPHVAGAPDGSPQGGRAELSRAPIQQATTQPGRRAGRCSLPLQGLRLGRGRGQRSAAHLSARDSKLVHRLHTDVLQIQGKRFRLRCWAAPLVCRLTCRRWLMNDGGRPLRESRGIRFSVGGTLCCAERR